MLTNVRRRAPVFKVSISLVRDMTGDTNGGTTVGNTRAELSDVTSLVLACQTEVVVFAIHGDVLCMSLAQLLNRGLNDIESTLLSHSLGGEVGVAASTVPVTREGLRVEGNLDSPLFSDTNE